MAGTAPEAAAGVSGKGLRFAIVAGRFHEAITERLVEGARATLVEHGAAPGAIEVLWAPGAFELPQVALEVARRKRAEAVVCVGCVIRGETPHFDYVAGEAARGIGEVARQTGLPVTFGVITADTMAQAEARSGGAVGNKGREAALAALGLLQVFAALRRPAGPSARPRPAAR